MAHAGGRRVDQDIEQLKASVDKYLSSGEHGADEAATDLARAVRELGDHVVDLHRRLEALENRQEQWTTHGWEPPPGSDRQP